ncbi:MAG TPA: hypothetical protein VGO59_18585 [Verrucomicrobiae bacterium]|jgi:hypothetical protein
MAPTSLEAAAALMRLLHNEFTMKKFFGLLMLSALLTGCTSITNLTPSHVSRDPSGFYRVEAEWYSQREVIRPGSFKPLVVVDGFNTYPMTPVPLVVDRWQAFIPIPVDKDMVYFHYKFDFQDDAFGGPRPNSMKSRDYELRVK